MAILNSDLLHGTMHHPKKFQANSQNQDGEKGGQVDAWDDDNTHWHLNLQVMITDPFLALSGTTLLTSHRFDGSHPHWGTKDACILNGLNSIALSPEKANPAIKICGICPTNQRPFNAANSVEHDQKLIRPGQAHYELAHPLWAQNLQRFVCKSTETPRLIRAQETLQIQWSVTKS